MTLTVDEINQQYLMRLNLSQINDVIADRV